LSENLKVILFFVDCLDSYIKSRFVIFICKFDEKIALRIKSNFVY